MAKKKEAKEGNFINKELKYLSKFISKYSILALAVGTVLGQATKDVVDTLVVGIIDPAIALFIAEGEFSDLSFEFRDSEFLIGLFLESLMTLVITMLLIYIVVRYILRKIDLLELDKKKKIKGKL